MSRSRGGRSLTGIIYLHKISDNRMSGTARRNIAMLHDLCGEGFMPNIVLATTMWDRVEAGEGEEREEEGTCRG